jgi:hypothetical protein
MNAAETRASRAMAAWTELAVVCRSEMTAEIETFINDVSTTSTNIAMASRTIRRRSLPTAGSPPASAFMRSEPDVASAVVRGGPNGLASKRGRGRRGSS